MWPQQRHPPLSLRPMSPHCHPPAHDHQHRRRVRHGRLESPRWQPHTTPKPSCRAVPTRLAATSPSQPGPGPASLSAVCFLLTPPPTAAATAAATTATTTTTWQAITQPAARTQVQVRAWHTESTSTPITEIFHAPRAACTGAAREARGGVEAAGQATNLHRASYNQPRHRSEHAWCHFRSTGCCPYGHTTDCCSHRVQCGCQCGCKQEAPVASASLKVRPWCCGGYWTIIRDAGVEAQARHCRGALHTPRQVQTGARACTVGGTVGRAAPAAHA